jgi:hypothetical protein
MFGSSKKNNSKEKSQLGVIGPDGRRLDVKSPDKRVKLNRTDAEIKILNSNPSGDSPDESASAILPARVILNEFSDTGVGVYTTEPLRKGQEVALTIDDPRRFYITGTVLFCNEIRSDSKILQQVVYPWRVGVAFIYKTDAERSEVAAYCEELRKNWLGALVPSVIPGPPKVANPTASTVAPTPAPTATPAPTDGIVGDAAKAVNPDSKPGDGTQEAA